MPFCAVVISACHVEPLDVPMTHNRVLSRTGTMCVIDAYACDLPVAFCFLEWYGSGVLRKVMLDVV